jgi:hypothetical protein
MTFKPAIWRPIASALGAVNLLAAGFAMGIPEPAHAVAHVGLAVAFGLWARRLGIRAAEGRGASQLDVVDALEALEAEMSDLRRELSDAQERLDFSERMLAQGAEARRATPER